MSKALRLFRSTSEYKLYRGKLSHIRCREIFNYCHKELGLDPDVLPLFVN